VGTRYLFYSHDGFGLGHVRRNSLIAQAVLEADPDARASLVTGLTVRPAWLRTTDRTLVHRVPPLLKADDGSYRHATLSFDDAVRERARIFTALVEAERPDVVVVDRHPYGTAGELRAGLALACSQGAVVVLGLRDVLDEPSVVRAELSGFGWHDVDEVYDDILVYGSRHFLDHEREYGLTRPVHYCGWVVEHPQPGELDRDLLVVAAGGGGDGAGVFELGAQVLARSPGMSALFAPGPYAGSEAVRRLSTIADGRAHIAGSSESCIRWFPRAGAVLCMAGYNSTLEALAAGHRPILVPRRQPRMEQTIRAERLRDLGLADVAHCDSDPAAVARLLTDRPRRLAAGALRAAGIDLDGAAVAASRLRRLCAVRSGR
jgi:predicted glycosyltransferase